MGFYKVIQLKIPGLGGNRRFKRRPNRRFHIARYRRRRYTKRTRIDLKKGFVLLLAALLLSKGMGLFFGQKKEESAPVQWQEEVQKEEESYPKRRKGIFLKDVMPFYGGQGKDSLGNG